MLRKKGSSVWAPLFGPNMYESGVVILDTSRLVKVANIVQETNTMTKILDKEIILLQRGKKNHTVATSRG